MTDELTNLLLTADRTAGLPPRGLDVARRVRRRRARRRRLTSAAGAVAAVVIVVGAGIWMIGLRGQRPPELAVHAPPAPAPPLDVARVRREAEQLSREADLHDATLALFARRALEQRQQPRPAAGEPRDVLADLRWQRERAAIVLVRQGDRLAHDLQLPDHAAVAYRQARDTFPGTRWGSVAEARLLGGQ